MNYRDTLTHVMQTYQSREEPERLYALAGKYWRIMLSIAVVLSSAAIVGGAYMLLITFFGFSSGNSAAVPSQVLNREQLTQTIHSFDTRNTRFRELKRGAPSVADPSR